MEYINLVGSEQVRAVDAFKWKLFNEWYDTLPLGAGDHVDVLYAAWLAGYQRHLDPGYHAAKQRESWTWVQPVGIETLLARLADARDFAVPERERENLCGVAHGMISTLSDALQGLVDDSYSLVEQPSWIRPSAGLGVHRCHHCEATKGERVRAHAMDCAVGCAENVLAGQEQDTRET